ncbi:MAG: hypothetical protein COT73_05820 [Bdellovibrio sp. CG10_big_fil_rev_8_21_14_0_10_47_8]|nr:MAG: hypothetical protein COT73_05820 [Bdellovibrio sp. CG10_big_fil_rev_8_21_14_0_10_47_8]
MTKTKLTIFVSLLTLALTSTAAGAYSSGVRSSSDIESSCRIKAKEIAADTYRNCVTLQKNSQIEQIKKEYQGKLMALKSHYESQLKKMSGRAEKNAPEAKETQSSYRVESSTDSSAAMTDDSTMDLPEPIPLEN